MGLYDRAKGSYYGNIFSKLASKTNVNIEIANLKDVYKRQTEMIGETFGKIDFDRDVMILKQSQFRAINNEIAIRKATFKIVTDTLIREKFNSLASGINISYISGLVNKCNTNLFNHKELSSDELEWERLSTHIPSSLGINWFSCKLNDRNIMNKLNNIIHIVKINNINGKSVEDYIQSNLILEIFICGPKGMTWLKLGKNSTFGYNIIIKYQSTKNNFDAKINSENYNNYKNFDINNMDLDMILNLGLSENDIVGANGNDVFIKVKTNIPASVYGGQHQYFISSNNKFNDYNEKKAINKMASKYQYFDNKDIMYYHRENKNFHDMINIHAPLFDSNQIINATTRYRKNIMEYDNQIQIYSKINSILTNTNRLRFNNSIIKNGNVLIGTNDIISGIHLSNIERFINNKYFNYEDQYNTIYDKTYFPLYNSDERIVDLFDYHNIGTPNLITKNENMYAVDSDMRSNGNTVLVNDINQKNFKTENALTNKLSNNKLIDYYSAKSINTGKKILIGGVNIGNINYICKTNVGIFASTNNGIYEFNVSTGTFKNTTIFSGKFGKIVELTDGFIAVASLDNNGIYKYDYSGSTETTKNFIKTNIVVGTFTDMVSDGDTLYAISNNGAYELVGDDRYRLLNTFFKYHDGNIVSFENLLSLEFNNDDEILRVTGNDFFNNETNDNTLNNFRLINVNGKFAVLKERSTMNFSYNNLYISSGNNKFGYFEPINSIIRNRLDNTDTNELIVYDVINSKNDPNQMYISFTTYEDASQTTIKQGVIKYRPSNNDVKLLETRNVNDINNKEYEDVIYVINGVTINLQDESIPLPCGKIFNVNGKIFVVPTPICESIIGNIEYCNGYYYIVMIDYKVYKLDDNFKVIEEIELDTIKKIFNNNNFLIMSGSSEFNYTDTSSLLSYPDLIVNDKLTYNGKDFKTKVIVKQ